MRKALFVIPFMMLFAACGGDRCRTPFGEGCSIDLSLPEFNSLYNNPGETQIIYNYGYRGILVRCVDFSEYVAFECACPHCREARMEPDDPRRASMLTCPECGSRFEVIFGNPLDGALTACMLFQYNTYFDGRYLSIF